MIFYICFSYVHIVIAEKGSKMFIIDYLRKRLSEHGDFEAFQPKE